MLKVQFARNVRRYWREGSLYVIRDVYQRDPTRLAGRRLMRCEFATRNPNGSKKWTRCQEGTEFSAIEPLRHRAT